MTIITRFAPSPSGPLHIGSARIAILNWLYAKQSGGSFRLRMEDTDRERSSSKFADEILKSLSWLGLNWDGNTVFQSKRFARYREVAQKLLKSGKAYYCCMTREEIQNRKNLDPHTKFTSPWREKNFEHKPSADAVIRLKSNSKEGIYNRDSIIFNDLVQGQLSLKKDELSDIILMRSDETPTYMFAVVVDDYDMQISTVIRGDDHITNTFQQISIYNALNWKLPSYAHVPLIHKKEGGKLSKRDGAISIEEYRKLGYLPEGMCNYLLKMGWGKYEEIMSLTQAMECFNIKDVSQAAARFDLDKLRFFNSHYIKNSDTSQLISTVSEGIKSLGTGIDLDSDAHNTIIHRAVLQTKDRAHTIIELIQYVMLYFQKINDDDEAANIINKYKDFATDLVQVASKLEDWSADSIKLFLTEHCKTIGHKPKVLMQVLRATIIGTLKGPGIFDMMCVIGKKNVLNRMQNAIQ